MSNLTDKKNHEFCKILLGRKERLESDFVGFIVDLRMVKQNRLYEPFWSDFDEYLHELRIEETAANKYFKLLEHYCDKLQLSTSQLQTEIVAIGGWNAAYELRNAITSKRKMKEWFGKARVLTVRDLRKELKEIGAIKPRTKCEHKDTFTIKICRDCGNKERVYDDK